MPFPHLKRRDVVALLAGAAALPLAARALEPAPTNSPRDPRLTPARSDLAAKELAGTVDAPRFVEGKAYEIAAAQAPVRGAPTPAAGLLTEALKGERLTIYDVSQDGWAWGQLAADGYVGYTPAAALGSPGPAATHKVSALRTFVFPGPSIKLPPTDTLSFGARLVVARTEDQFAVTAAGGYVPSVNLAPVATNEADFVAVAERFLGTPYLWGGKTSLGIDCSGLVQIALNACGVKCPRDSDMQEQALGSTIGGATRALAQLRRGDLIFWKGHVAIVRDDATLVHASAQRMAVVYEPTAAAIARIRPDAGEVTSVRRLPAPA